MVPLTNQYEYSYVWVPQCRSWSARTALPQFRCKPIDADEIITEYMSRVTGMVNFHPNGSVPAAILNSPHHFQFACALRKIQWVSTNRDVPTNRGDVDGED